MVAFKMLAAMARMPGMGCQGAYAHGAYTHTVLKREDTWVELLTTTPVVQALARAVPALRAQAI